MTTNGEAGRLKVNDIIIQLSAPEDRGPQEESVAAEGFVPLVVFANGPEHAFLVRTTNDILDSALEAAQDRLDEPQSARLAFRRQLFEAMQQAIESDFSGENALEAFPTDALQLFAEGLSEQGIDQAADAPACAVRFAKDNLAAPDFETAEDDDEDE